jgi:hypothetical protein
VILHRLGVPAEWRLESRVYISCPICQRKHCHSGLLRVRGYIGRPFSQPAAVWTPAIGEKRFGQDDNVRSSFQLRGGPPPMFILLNALRIVDSLPSREFYLIDVFLHLTAIGIGVHLKLHT